MWPGPGSSFPAREEADLTVGEATVVVAGVAEAVLAEKDPEGLLIDFSGRIEEAAADAKVEGFNRAASLSAERWQKILLLAISKKVYRRFTHCTSSCASSTRLFLPSSLTSLPVMSA